MKYNNHFSQGNAQQLLKVPQVNLSRVCEWDVFEGFCFEGLCFCHHKSILFLMCTKCCACLHLSIIIYLPSKNNSHHTYSIETADELNDSLTELALSRWTHAQSSTLQDNGILSENKMQLITVPAATKRVKQKVINHSSLMRHFNTILSPISL